MRIVLKKATVATVASAALFTMFFSRPSEAQQRQLILRRPLLDSLLRTPGKSIVHVNTAGVSKAVTTQTDSIALKPGEVIVKETGTKPTLHTVTQNQKRVAHYDLPSTIIATTADNKLVGFSIVVEAQTLAFDAAHTRFTGDVLVGLEDSLHRTERDDLAKPIDVQINSENAAIVPAQQNLRLTHTNVPFESVSVAGSVSGIDTVFLDVQPSFGSTQRIGVVLGRPKLSIGAPATIAAYGLEKAHVTVSAAPTDVTSRRQVTLTALHSQPTTSALIVSPDTLTAVTDLPSGTPGDDMIQVQGEPFSSVTRPITYEFPTWFILFAFLGGAFGSVIKVMGAADKSTVLGKPLALGLTGGTLAGLVVAVGAAIGVNLTPVSLPHEFSEALGFVTAAVGAIAGIQVTRGR